MTTHANHIMSKKAVKVRSYNFSYCQHWFLYTHTYVLAGYTGKKYWQNWILTNRFKIAFLFCSDNKSDNSLLGLFLLLLIVILSEHYQIREGQKLNYSRNKNRRSFSGEWHNLFDYTLPPMSLFDTFFVDPVTSSYMTYFLNDHLCEKLAN